MRKTASILALLILTIITSNSISEPSGTTIPANSPVGRSLILPDYKTTEVTKNYPNGIQATLDVPYAEIMGIRPLTLDIYRSGKNNKAQPAVVFVHGGSYVGGNPRTDINPVFGENDALMAFIAAQGYVVIAVSYRLADEAKWPAQLIDVKASIRWLRGNAHKLGVDPKRIAVWGESAGGHIAAMVGATCGFSEFEQQTNIGIYGNVRPTTQDKYLNQSSCVQAAVLWSAATDFSLLDHQSEDFTRLIHNSPVSSQSRVLGCALGITCTQLEVQKASAIHYVKLGGARNTHFLLQAGTKDEATPWQQSQLMYDTILENNGQAELSLVEGANHYFKGVNKQQAQQILQTFISFLNEKL